MRGKNCFEKVRFFYLKGLCCCLLILLTSNLTAESLYELPELLIDYWNDASWNRIDSTQASQQIISAVKTSARYQSTSEKWYSTSQMITVSNSTIYAQGRLYSDMVNDKHIGDAYFSWQGKGLLQQLAIGNYRVMYGTGLLFNAKKNTCLEPSTSPLRYALQGVSAVFSLTSFSVNPFFSKQLRSCSINNGKIISLSTLRTQDNLTNTTESIQGLSITYNNNDLHLGTLFFRQNYDISFADSIQIVDFNCLDVNIFSKVLDNLTVNGELACIKDKIAYKGVTVFQTSNFKQQLSVTNMPNILLQPYQSSLFIMQKKPQQSEISYDCIYKLYNSFNIHSRNAVAIMNNQISNNYRSRNIIGAAFQDKALTAGLDFYHFEKELSIDADSLDDNFLQHQYRIKTFIAKPLSSYLIFHSALQYQHQKDSALHKNAVIQDYSLQFNNSRVRATLGWLAWHTAAQIAVESSSDNGLDPYEILSSDDNQFYFICNYHYRNLKVSTSQRYYNSLDKYTLSLSFEFALR